MRITFGRISLFNDTFFPNMTWFYMQQKRVGRELHSGETDREREKEREMECCCKRVTAWAINLTVGTNIYDS